MRHLAYGLRYVLRHHLLGTDDPLILGLALTNRCNLRCRHCRIPARSSRDSGFLEITGVLDAYRERGGRCLYLEGGEPFLWHDGEHRLEDVVQYAHDIGFLAVIVYTNGMLSLETSADTVFVSVDGLEETHDALRGRSFERVRRNLDRTSHRSLYVNFTINSVNRHEIEAFCTYFDEVPSVRGVFFYFHTPYYGEDDLYLPSSEREKVLHELLALKGRHRILNSRAGLRSALRNDWRRPLEACTVYEGGETYACCRYSGDLELCRDCGYLSYAEIDQTLKLKPSAVLNAVSYF